MKILSCTRSESPLRSTIIYYPFLSPEYITCRHIIGVDNTYAYGGTAYGAIGNETRVWHELPKQGRACYFYQTHESMAPSNATASPTWYGDKILELPGIDKLPSLCGQDLLGDLPTELRGRLPVPKVLWGIKWTLRITTPVRLPHVPHFRCFDGNSRDHVASPVSALTNSNYVSQSAAAPGCNSGIWSLAACQTG